MVDPELQKIIDIDRELGQMREKISCIKTGAMKKTKRMCSLLEKREKLKYRLGFLKKILKEESGAHPELSTGGDDVNIEMKIIPLKKHLCEYFTNVIHAAYPHFDGQDAIVVALDPSQAFECGDFECINAPLIAKTFKVFKINSILEKVGKALLKNAGPSPCIRKMDLMISGNINIFLNRYYLVEAMANLLTADMPPLQASRKRVVVEFSSPNIAEEMSVCHLRSTILGESICRLLEFFNHDVIRQSLVNDWGISAGILVTHLKEKFPNFMKKFPKIPDLPAFFQEANKRYISDWKFVHAANKCYVLLYNNDLKVRHAWNALCELSRKYFKAIYTRLNVTLTEQGESFYQLHIKETLNYLKSQKLLHIQGDKSVMEVEHESRKITVIFEDPNGVPTDIATKIAVVRHRIEEQKADWLFYVADYDQDTKFEQAFLACETAKFISPYKNRIDQLLVTGEFKYGKEGKSHDFKVIALLDQSLSLALEKLKKKGYHKLLQSRDLNAAQQSLAYGSFKYAFLRHNDNEHSFVLDLDKIFDENFEVVLYMFNTYARIWHILSTRKEPQKNAKTILELALKETEAYCIARRLFVFYDVLSDISTEFNMHMLCEYCENLCQEFTEFYKRAEKEEYAILFCKLVLKVLTKAFDILGLNPVQNLFKPE